MSRAKTVPIILIDTREQMPYLFSDFGIETLVTTIHTGDYSIALKKVSKKGEEIIRYDHLISIERKSMENWVTDISDEEGRKRLEENLERGSQLDYYAVFIEGSELDILRHDYIGKVVPNSVLNTKIHWSVKYGIPIELCDNRFCAEYRTYTALMAFLKYQKEKNKKQRNESIKQVSNLKLVESEPPKQIGYKYTLMGV